jgi:hypothetical protein
MARFIFRCGRKACGHRWARDYSPRQVRLGYGRTETVFERTNEYGRKIESGYDTACPACGQHERVKFGRVKGYVSDHECDARCTGATGFQCECSCGGRNHGRQFLICETLKMESV